MAGAALQEIREELQQDFDRKKEQIAVEVEIKNSKEMLLEAISEKFGAVSPDLVRRINSMDSPETLKMLFKQTFRVESLEEFKEQVHRVTNN